MFLENFEIPHQHDVPCNCRYLAPLPEPIATAVDGLSEPQTDLDINVTWRSVSVWLTCSWYVRSRTIRRV